MKDEDSHLIQVRLPGGSLLVLTQEEFEKIQRRGDPVWGGALKGGAIMGAWCALVCGQGLDSPDLWLPSENTASGATIFTRIPNSASSKLAIRPNWWLAALVAL